MFQNTHSVIFFLVNLDIAWHEYFARFENQDLIMGKNRAVDQEVEIDISIIKISSIIW